MRNERSAAKNGGVRALLGLVFSIIGIIALVWLMLSIYQSGESSSDQSIKAQKTSVRDVTAGFDNTVNNLKSNALSDMVHIRKRYVIPEDAVVAPKPDKSCYGSTADPEKVREVIAQASELLDGQSLVWTGEEELFPGSEIQYYYDETILVICWKEVINKAVCTFAEVKIADSSQFRRYLSGNSYGSGIQLKASDMANSVNAVVAINGDFYTFRNEGITVYQRSLYKFHPKRLQTAFFNTAGEMSFLYENEITDEDEMKRYIADNDILFSLSFGPVLVDDGELRQVSTYPAGEVNEIYARSAIGNTDELHYLLMTVNGEGSFKNVVTVNNEAKLMYNKGCRNAYALDGGQTAVIIMNGSTVNRVVYGYERTMSDIVYFASAKGSEG